ncbi:probable Dolichyl-phosphate-mannose--protein mannosyltransferase 6 [Saccharomycodes ludwigii]|uniref:Dolichyl-phosphate-mannose--protein mannosyltransferase n=1 Tax=Saccharomycodes ludwigii TaxID=36035 RepID=A0A376B8I5_9ASCO|nr:hypothetical protein SCDLUD_004684 [Saccharomycodes ludwigii]KAH3899250.1 hypothetical protein SCDLUD_004684 [Saccharomycodes ludwigii]SSD60986.1 probable Dolichyl-phosphate-mannose--protein mannosyltransferase 6 [Saccharomycodes ludwigii]
MCSTEKKDPFKDEQKNIKEETLYINEEEKRDEIPENRSVKRNVLIKIRDIVAPLLITFLSFYLRFDGIAKSRKVVWDEAHFGKFGAHYIKHDFYHDVHPPLGKMLIGLSEYLAGFNNTEFNFESGAVYPDDVDFKTMRQFNAVFGALCAPVAYFTAKELNFNSIFTVYLISLMVCCELTYVCLSKFILLDSILLFFTFTTYHCMVKLYKLRKEQLTKKWWLWLFLTGINIGCVCSVKWVGLFVTASVGVYTVWELFQHHCDSTLTWKKYSRHWLLRIINLIVIPFLVYLFCFRVHFTLLYKSGEGDGVTNSLFQANLQGSKIDVTNTPRDVYFGSKVTIRSHGLSPSLLHSHIQTYPKGSNQHQVTGYGHMDSNNDWIIKYPRSEHGEENYGPVYDGSLIRLSHVNMGCNLHSHEIPSHVSKGNFEVSGYGSEIVGDKKDDWVVEIVKQLKPGDADYPEEDPNVLHPISTYFRLRHKQLGCYLTTTGLTYPNWGFNQNEIVCKDSWMKKDKSTWWNIEYHTNEKLPAPEKPYVVPKSSFWEDFVLINYAMASSNNALVPDYDKYDNLASDAWEWPTLHIGLRLCGWSSIDIRYYLLGSPFNTWLSTLSLVILVNIFIVSYLLWKRQVLRVGQETTSDFFIKGIMPFISWAFHYLPFVIMARVTYVHHYLPALYFAMLVFVYVVDLSLGKLNKFIRVPLYLLLLCGCLYTYLYFAPFAQGMEGNPSAYAYLKWLPGWKI